MPIYQTYGYGVEKHQNPLNITEEDFLVVCIWRYLMHKVVMFSLQS
ncbi:hypothetical protein NARC_50073 [Candidatus Nitrosocosmicus arcticus]|uniref:Uncharacterized protein n=1 Tax=Candidatus Nitrosocosmicus arcticus TaxID=2035267 RepID=A0A557SWB1_9ARCH|nr:hypothetical protein NARC_50073 [Candidatus Nitrosocosmicus arcticus]